MTYTCSTWQLVSGIHVLKLQRPEKKMILRVIDKFSKRILVLDLRMGFQC
jgi:hypothetical protein